MPNHKIAFVASRATQAQDALQRLTGRYGNVSPAKAEVIVALGGDGHMLQTLHRHIKRQVPIYGMHRGSVGFLMNTYRETRLIERLKAATPVTVHPLRMRATTANGKEHDALAINEVSLLRETRQAAKLRISIDNVQRLQPVGTRSDHTARRRSARAHADQRLPSTPLAWGAVAEHGQRDVRHSRA